MPRKTRNYIAGVPSHIVQRGNDCNACFFEEEDYRFYLQCLEDACRRYKVSLHAYVLMTNHVHLLMTPIDTIGISRVMQLTGNRYVQYINKKYKKTGTLWEGRHKSSLIDAENYLLACYRYIELNPVRAGMVSHPADYLWSSYHHHATDKVDLKIIDHDVYNRIDNDIFLRKHAYRELINIGLGDRDIYEIRKSVQFSKPLGNKKFKEQIITILDKKGDLCIS
jgi:putative transposase